MHDPREGVGPDGTIVTGADRQRVSRLFAPVLDSAVAGVGRAEPSASLYLYGSVATGTAKPPASDVDLLAVGLRPDAASRIGADLSTRFADRSRGVAVATGERSDFSLDTEAGYGGCAFLRHYCVHLSGPDLHSHLPPFPADARAARGFNGDIAEHAARWRVSSAAGEDPVRLGRRLARKTLFAVAGLVSVHDTTWTTDRTAAAIRWGEVRPALADDLRMLLAWSGDASAPDPSMIEAALDGVVAEVVADFTSSIGLWTGG